MLSWLPSFVIVVIVDVVVVVVIVVVVLIVVDVVVVIIAVVVVLAVVGVVVVLPLCLLIHFCFVSQIFSPKHFKRNSIKIKVRFMTLFIDSLKSQKSGKSKRLK